MVLLSSMKGWARERIFLRLMLLWVNVSKLFVLGLREVAEFFLGAAIFICPTYWLLRAFDGCGYKVWCSGLCYSIVLNFF